MHVLLINEGTYPFRWGGVSTWCHLLICDLPDIEFTLFSLVAEPQNEPRFTLPANVVDSYTVPLWGICETLETRADLSLAELQQRRKMTLPAIIEQEFVPI